MVRLNILLPLMSKYPLFRAYPSSHSLHGEQNAHGPIDQTGKWLSSHGCSNNSICLTAFKKGMMGTIMENNKDSC